MTYFYWFILKASADSPDSNTKPSIDSFSPLREQWQYLEHTGRWSVQIESEVTPSEAVGLFKELRAMSRCWINGAVFVNGVAVGGPWDAGTFYAFVSTYELTYASQRLEAL
jgi:hypothetical protein